MHLFVCKLKTKYRRGFITASNVSYFCVAGLFSLVGFSVNAATCPGSVCNLNIHGVVTATSCDVESSSQLQTVNLGNVSVGAFKNTGDVSNSQSFHIKLKNCSSNINGGAIAFQGAADDNNSDLLKLTAGSGVAIGVGVQILDGASGSPIVLGQSTATQPLVAGDNDLVYALRYKSTTASVVPGTANAVMYFDLNYQ
ncbi:fimbrial protein [Klebsiella aerogenes]|uniref:fimbrial protein n=1 Tax=Klebsiella aerogenes TaxID=548 RepID=UPI0021D1CF39|nr:fimbrial protein [Klebsiella aerogenes]MCU6317028.1 fimbrial protein [Klebsiella aerogenes]